MQVTGKQKWDWKKLQTLLKYSTLHYQYSTTVFLFNLELNFDRACLKKAMFALPPQSPLWVSDLTYRPKATKCGDGNAEMIKPAAADVILRCLQLIDNRDHAGPVQSSRPQGQLHILYTCDKVQRMLVFKVGCTFLQRKYRFLLDKWRFLSPKG